MSKLNKSSAIDYSIADINKILSSMKVSLLSPNPAILDNWGNMTVEERQNFYNAIINEAYWKIDNSLSLLQADLLLEDQKENM